MDVLDLLRKHAEEPDLDFLREALCILTQAVLRGLSATDPRQVCAAIDRFTAARNEHPVPFEWTKALVQPVGLAHRYADLRK
jgi:hypothetical protein